MRSVNSIVTFNEFSFSGQVCVCADERRMSMSSVIGQFSTTPLSYYVHLIEIVTHLSVVLRPTFYVLLCCMVLWGFSFELFSIRSTLFIHVNHWSVLL